jgi:malate dehydrogenase (oxaloacetate-decarboxylating)(NADP+)
MLQLIGMAKGVTRVATTNVMMTQRGPLFLSDTAINIDPSAEDLARIAYMTSKVCRLFGVDPLLR